MNKQAYATVLCNGEGYLPGVEALGHSLSGTGSPHPMVLMVTPDVRASTRDQLSQQGWSVREIESISNPNPSTQQMLPRFGAAYTKLRAWQLTDFDKVVLLDADTIVLQNIDDLFTRPEISAAPDFFLPDRLSSGVMVLEPRQATFERMVSQLSSAESYDGGDQGFLNIFFENWYALPVAHRLPVGYNMPHFIYEFMRAHPSTWRKLRHEIKIVHYVVQKPWQVRATLTGASEIWWDSYFAVHPEKANNFLQHVHEMEDRSFDTLVRWVVG